MQANSVRSTSPMKQRLQRSRSDIEGGEFRSTFRDEPEGMGEDLSLIKEVGSDSGTRHYDKKVLLDMCYVDFLKLTF